MGTSLRRNWERRAVADSDIYCTNASTSSSASEPHEVQKIVLSELELPVRIGSVLKMFTWRTCGCRRKREASETFVLVITGMLISRDSPITVHRTLTPTLRLLLIFTSIVIPR